MDEAGAALLHELLDGVGALVSGRHLFDLTDGWGDRHPVGAPVVVVTHRPPPPDAADRPRTTFVGDVTTAITTARELAAGADVVLSSPGVIGEALDLGLLDEIAVSLVPLVMGSGKRYFDDLRRAPFLLDDPVVVPGLRATHLRYAVRRPTD